MKTQTLNKTKNFLAPRVHDSSKRAHGERCILFHLKCHVRRSVLKEHITVHNKQRKQTKQVMDRQTSKQTKPRSTFHKGHIKLTKVWQVISMVMKGLRRLNECKIRFGLLILPHGCFGVSQLSTSIVSCSFLSLTKCVCTTAQLPLSVPATQVWCHSLQPHQAKSKGIQCQMCEHSEFPLNGTIHSSALVIKPS